MGDIEGKIPKETHSQLIQRAREFRKHPTQTEAVLWGKLRARQIGGYKFKRQKVFGPFILDFFCPECKLAVELDGGVHQRQREYDEERTLYLQSYNVFVIRFKNEQVLEETDHVLEEILDMCKQLSRQK